MEKSKKRVEPDPVKPLKIGDVLFEAIHWGDEIKDKPQGGYVRATHTRGKDVTIFEIYQTQYNDNMESDKQDVFITELKAGSTGHLIIKDEDGRTWDLDIASRKVKQI